MVYPENIRFIAGGQETAVLAQTGPSAGGLLLLCREYILSRYFFIELRANYG